MITTGAPNETHVIGRFDFYTEDTGGGCLAYVYRDPDTEACLVLSNTGMDDNLKQDEDVILSLYLYDDEEGESVTLYEGLLSGLTEEVIDEQIKKWV